MNELLLQAIGDSSWADPLIDVLVSRPKWAIRALVSSILVGVMCGLLGCFIVLRNMAMIGDALSHAVLPGVVFGFVFAGGYNVFGFFFGAVVAGLITAVAITWFQQNFKTRSDAAIGIVFTSMFSIGVIAITTLSRRDGVHLDLKDFLFGNVLGVSDPDLQLMIIVTVVVVISIVLFFKQLFATTFQPIVAQTMGISVKKVHYFLMLLLSFAVVASLKSVGVILVVAMLVTPASAASLLTKRLHTMLMVSTTIAIASSIIGLVFAILLGTTPGPCMALVATGFYLSAAIFAPEQGQFFKWLRKQKREKRINREDVLKRVWKITQRDGKPAATRNDVQDLLSLSGSAISIAISGLKRDRQLNIQGEKLTLTESGIQEGNRLVRAHRLWETYLVQTAGMDAATIHDEAEKLEHELSDELLDEVDAWLGFPETDPHGSPIPMKRPGISLHSLQAGSVVKLSARQVGDIVTAELWRLAIVPGEKMKVVSSNEHGVELQLDDRTVSITSSLAKRINVDRA